MTSISYAVMAHPFRIVEAERLAQVFDAELVLDSERSGENPTADRAWAALCGADWHVVMQDDALPVPEAHSAVQAALEAAPSSVVSLYFGTNYPRSLAAATKHAARRADRSGLSWLLASRLAWGVAVAIRADLVSAMLAAVVSDQRPYDRRLSAWCKAQRLRVAYTWPSLVDHADGPSLIGRPRPLPRRAHRVGVPLSWDTAAMAVGF